MLKSPTHKFQSVVTHNSNSNVKQKRRRKKRKKLYKINNLNWNSLSLRTSTIKVSKRKSVNKTKQYYQHDNRLGQSKGNSKQSLFKSSKMVETFSKNTMESEIYYKEVAKKFKPLNNSAKNKNLVKTNKVFLKNHSQKNSKTIQRKKFAYKSAGNELENKSTISPTATLTLMQPQFCICSCRNDNDKYNTDSVSHNNNFQLQAAVFANFNPELSRGLINCATDRKNGLGHSYNHTPTMFFDRFIDNTTLIKYLEESSSVYDKRLLAEVKQEHHARLREFSNISEYFAEGSSLDTERKAEEDIAKSLALQRKLVSERKQSTEMETKETSKIYASVRTPSMEHDSSKHAEVLAPDKSNRPLKKKKKKRMRESSPSPERKKDKKKKSKKSKKESKPKKLKKVRRRKGSESETNADNDVDEDSGTDEIEAYVKKSRKKSKKDKKKRRTKRREMSSSDETRSRSPSDKIAKNNKCESLNERTYRNYQSRSRSKEKSVKLKEFQTQRYESSYNHSERSKSRSYSRSNKNSSNRRDESKDRYETQDLNSKHQSHSRENQSRDPSDSSKNYGNQKSTSLIKSKPKTIEKTAKNLKRKHSDKHLCRKEESPKTDKRKRYTQSRSSSITEISCEKTTTAENEDNSYKQHSRTPNRKLSKNRSKFNKSISRSSSLKGSLKNISFSPVSQTSKRNEPFLYEENTKDEKNKDNQKYKDNLYNTSRSRSISLSSQTTSTTDTRMSKSRTPSPRKEYLENLFVSNSLGSQKRKEEILNSPSPAGTSTPIQRRSPSTSQSRFEVNGRGRIGKKSSRSSKESLNCRKEKRDQKSRTPPKIEKKISSPRSSRDSSELSYSPARRNPERYQDILENTRNEKRKIGEHVEDRKEMEWERKDKGGKNESNQTKPVVRLHSQSDEESDVPERNTEKNLDEFQEYKRERELNELKMLEHLKTGLAAKAKEKIKTIEKLAASTSSENLSTNNDGEVNDKSYKRIVRNSLNDFLAANNAAPALVATCSPGAYNGTSNSPLGAIYPQTFEEVKKEQESVLQLTENLNSFDNNKETKKDTETMFDSKKALMTANSQTSNVSPTASPLRNNLNVINKERDRKRERDLRENERERECYNFNKDRYLERRQKSIPGFYSMGGGGLGSGNVSVGNMGVGRRNTNSSMININYRQRLNIMCNSAVVGAHHHPHSHLHPHHHHPNHKLINNHHNSAASSFFLGNNSSNPHTLLCNHANNSTNISFNRPSRINNTPLITATQFNNQMLSKQSNSILVNRRDHRTALNLGLSGTPCTNFSNSNLLLTKANPNTHHLHAAAVGHAVGGGHHHHHHSQNAGMSSGGSTTATQITDRILMAASFAAAQRHSFGVHSTVSNAAAVAAANNLNFLHQQNKPKLVIKPFKINDSQPLVAALADSSLVDAIVSKVSTATVAAAESAARRSRSRSRRSRSRNRHEEKSSGVSNNGGNRHRSQSRSRSSRSSTSSRSRGRSHSHRSSRSRTSQSSSTTHTSSRSSSSSFGTSRSGTRSPSIPRRRGSPSFLDRRRITSARKRPIPYHRKLSSDVSSCYCSSCCSRESSPHSRSPSRDSRSPSRFFET